MCLCFSLIKWNERLMLRHALGYALYSSGSSGRVRRGARNKKSMWPPLAPIFFMTYFHRAGGGGAWSPRPPGSATDLFRGTAEFKACKHFSTEATLICSRHPTWHKDKMCRIHRFMTSWWQPCLQHSLSIFSDIREFTVKIRPLPHLRHRTCDTGVLSIWIKIILISNLIF